MSRQVYFVVSVDLDTKQLWIDDETFTSMFSRSQEVWDTELNDWRGYGEGEYELALDILNKKEFAND
jgi:hypothetical protein